MNLLILSDLHLGNPLFYKERQVIDLLNDSKYDQVIINGDLIDIWEDSVLNIIQDNSVINVINQSCQDVVIIPGNHDPKLNILKTIFPKHLVVNKYEMILNSNPAIFIHGEEFDKLVTKYYWVAKILFPIQWSFERLHLDPQGYLRDIYYSISNKRNKKCYNDLVLQIEKDLVQKYRNDYYYIICGHTHFPKISCNEYVGYCYINSGDLIHNFTYVEYVDKQFYLRRL